MNHIRRITHPDGRREVIRVLDPESLEQWTPDSPWAFEHSIVWLRDIRSLDFVRVATVRSARSRQGSLRAGDVSLTVVGYSKLTDDAPPNSETKAYVRRIFFLREDDADRNMNAIPSDAVDPQTLVPGGEGSPPRPANGTSAGYPYQRLA